ncbi:unnamed protein product, partial [Staurois parvus]
MTRDCGHSKGDGQRLRTYTCWVRFVYNVKRDRGRDKEGGERDREREIGGEIRRGERER